MARYKFILANEKKKKEKQDKYDEKSWKLNNQNKKLNQSSKIQNTTAPKKWIIKDFNNLLKNELYKNVCIYLRKYK